MALEGAVLERYGDSGIHSLGIHNCRRVAGTQTWSLHAEGRAVDLGVIGADPGTSAAVLHDLRSCGDFYLQRIMFDHRTYDAGSPAGRPISGSNPHTDHLHVELSWLGARGEIALQLPDDTDHQEDLMPGLLVAWRGAQWLVAGDLSSKMGLAQSADVQALLAAGYRATTLTDGLMQRIATL